MGSKYVRGGAGSRGTNGAREGSPPGEEDSGTERGSAWGARTGLPDDDVFEVLRNRRRRDVLSYLFACGPTATLRELTDHVASAEYGVDAADLSPAERKRVYTALHQCHLPRLDRAGVIAFDGDEKTVRLRAAAERIEPYLGARRDSTGAELAVATGVSVAVTLGVLGIGPLGAVPATSWAVLTVVALVGFGLVQLYQHPRGRPKIS